MKRLAGDPPQHAASAEVQGGHVPRGRGRVVELRCGVNYRVLTSG